MSITEHHLVERIRNQSLASLPKRRSGAGSVLVGIGDDCAVLDIPSGHETLVTTDFSLEGIHFRREWHSPDTIGHRCLTRGLSDIAAMGGEPVAAFLSLAVPAETPQRWIDQFIAGMLHLAKRFGVTLAGGDIAQSPNGVLADICVVGSVPAGKAILRSGARPGDRIFVTGELGAPIALLEEMFAVPKRKFRPASYPAHFYPQPQVEVGRYLREKGIPSAMIDISDGLSTDLARICEESGVGAVISANAVPVASLGRHEVDLRHALHGGDEYQLLFTAPLKRRVPNVIAGVPVTLIGYIDESGELAIEHENGYTTELEPEGWEHFSAGAKSKVRTTRK